MSLNFIMGSFITMHLIVKVFKVITSWNFQFVVILPCYPEYTFSPFDVRFSYQIECAILSSPGRAVCVPSIIWHGWKRHVTNTTTLKIVITYVLFVNYTQGPCIYRDTEESKTNSMLHNGLLDLMNR